MQLIKIKTILAIGLFVMSQLSFSNSPGIIFMNSKGEVKTVFLAGEEIHGKINIAKPLKEYLKGETAKQIRIDVRSLSNEVIGIPVTKTLRASELNNSFIDFDVYPSVQNAKDVYESGVGFFFSLYPTNVKPKGIVKFEISVNDDYNENYNGLLKMEVSGEMSIDYSKITAAEYSKLWSKGREAHDAAEANQSKYAAIESAEIAKSLPLPIVFTKPSKAGYKGYTNATIINMIKQRYKIDAVYMLTFDEPEGSGDFTALKDLNNYPSEKLGNHIFYFAFKDNIDGQYKFAGGRLRMLYEGNGKYSDPVIFPYSPLMNNDPKFPFDYGRKNLGFESVFFMDGAKIKK